MNVIRLPLYLLFPLLAACGGCPDEHIGDILSPDGLHKVELRSCGCKGAVKEYTQVNILEADQQTACFSALGIAGFDAPFDHRPLQVRWLSNEAVEASYAGEGEFPGSQYRQANAEVTVVFTDRSP